ncbi:hypothetical protein Pint_03960 [Pistacia integerrima]|uniref:Uncharacterized protein n=1 Tax=Pistacia integerrima TaxID=434235 RepID=A0ACC0YZW0_9ROSI|nr:hypothetical protein Pint_03960 [Pistacia integerrima]
MKQTIVIKVDVINCNNCRAKAMETANDMDGIESVRLVNRENIVVTGDGVDAAKLCSKLKKKLGFASLEIVKEFKETTEDNYGTNPTP